MKNQIATALLAAIACATTIDSANKMETSASALAEMTATSTGEATIDSCDCDRSWQAPDCTGYKWRSTCDPNRCGWEYLIEGSITFVSCKELYVDWKARGWAPNCFK